MASSSGKVCGSCDVRHLTEAAIEWCTTCDEGLCSTCLEYHQVNKASRTHHTIPVSQYASLESITCIIKQECKKHEQLIMVYCLDHDVAACGLCIPENHRQCTELKPIDELAHDAKNSVDLLDIERGFEEVGKTLTELKSNKQQNIDTIKDNKKTISTEIRSIRHRLNKHFDEMESGIFKDLDTNISLNCSELDQLVSKIMEKEHSIEQTRKSIKKVKEGLSNVQVFLVTKHLKGKLREEENWASKVCQEDAAQGFLLKLQPNPQLAQLLNELNSYGKIQTVRTPCQIKIGTWNQKRAQLVVPTIPIRDKDKIELKLERTIQLKGDCCSGCIIVPGGRLVFAIRSNNQISVYSKDEQFSASIDVGRYPCDLAIITTNTVAVSCRDSKSVNIVNIDERIVKQSIDVRGTCHGLSYYIDKLYVLVQSEGIYELNLHGHLFRTIPVDCPENLSYLSIQNEKFVYTSNGSPQNRFIACCDFSGKEIWRSSSANSGVSVDQFGNCFAAHYLDHTITIISMDAKREKQLLSKTHHKYHLEGVFFDNKNNTLLVTMQSGIVYLYRVI